MESQTSSRSDPRIRSRHDSITILIVLFAVAVVVAVVLRLLGVGAIKI